MARYMLFILALAPTLSKVCPGADDQRWDQFATRLLACQFRIWVNLTLRKTKASRVTALTTSMAVCKISVSERF